ncbi:hypothetical protein QVD17_30945 [Tagetes erecta]|uniref:Uncharacterized protein n=1 Tax=Tagetes erecta TaxID=13708 RepID=A0AAD8NNW2_TARER|nr:hypothetical protein QVD17_30945 [Tagetes erecta]
MLVAARTQVFLLFVIYTSRFGAFIHFTIYSYCFFILSLDYLDALECRNPILMIMVCMCVTTCVDDIEIGFERCFERHFIL